jgi:hypothetical protein
MIGVRGRASVDIHATGLARARAPDPQARLLWRTAIANLLELLPPPVVLPCF